MERHDSSIPIVGLMCHAPIVIPAVGGERSAECAKTTRAMSVLAERVVKARPDVLIVVSPHTPRYAHAWGIVRNARLIASMQRFGASDVVIDLPGAPDARRAIAGSCRKEDATLEDLDLPALDHGAAVPLWFLQKAKWCGPTVVIGLPGHPDGRHDRLGRAVRGAARACGQRWAVIASGDMSHRLIPEAPAGYDPRAAEFDRSIVETLRSGRTLRLSEIDSAMRESAGEDVVDTLLVVEAAIAGNPRNREVLAYEGPFGVGYCEAVLHAVSGEI